jgi:pimeloyl-ACP methyl ester carboxylesterase
MKHPGKTRPFRGRQGEPVPASIAEINYLRLGGLDQWVMIRGESLANRPLIHLHGGPGFSEMRLFLHYNAPLEKSFTIVSWDQRGTAKSFDRRIPRSSMTVEQFVADLAELVDAVCTRVGQNKVAIFGALVGLCARRALCHAVLREGRGLCRLRTVWRMGGGRVGIVCLRTRRGPASRQPQGPEGPVWCVKQFFLVWGPLFSRMHGFPCADEQKFSTGPRDGFGSVQSFGLHRTSGFGRPVLR